MTETGDNPQSSRHTQWDRDAALTTARILLEIKAINFRPEDPYTLTFLGNHDRKLGRALEGRRLRRDPPLEETLRQLSDPEYDTLRQRAYEEIAGAPVWVRLGNSLFVHGGFHTAMLSLPPMTGLGDMSAPLSRALFGETTGRMQPDGYPERRLSWINRIPEGMTVYVGHDRRSTDGRPWRRTGRLGGTAVFTDLGAGKGGHLAWIDINDP